ncbi:MAG: hypothetical protein IJB86_01930 [Clostridia bacterium]|nr:hypothetical protein [Clostridia bacterium]
MKHNVKKPPLPLSKKEIYLCRCFIFLSFALLLFLRSFFRGASADYFERLSWFLKFNFITNSTFTEALNSNWFKPFAAVLFTVFLYLISVLLEKFYHSFSNENPFGKITTLQAFIACPGLFLYYCSPTVQDRAGFIVLILILIRLLYFKKNFLIWFTPVFSVLCILIQHKSFLTFYPAVFIINLIILEEGKNKKFFLFCDAVISLITFASVSSFNFIAKDITAFYEVLLDLVSSLPVVAIILFVFIKAFSGKKEIVYLIVPILFSAAALSIVSDNGAVVAEMLISLALIIIFGVINSKTVFINQVEAVIDFCQTRAVTASALLFFEVFFLRIDPSYFGNAGYSLFEHFSF